MLSFHAAVVTHYMPPTPLIKHYDCYSTVSENACNSTVSKNACNSAVRGTVLAQYSSRNCTVIVLFWPQYCNSTVLGTVLLQSCSWHCTGAVQFEELYCYRHFRTQYCNSQSAFLAVYGRGGVDLKCANLGDTCVP